MERDHGRRHKLGAFSGVFVPVCLSILSILMFLRFGLILGQVGLLGMFTLLVLSYLIDLVTTLSLSAVATNGEVKGGGAYYLISRSLGPEFGGAIGLLFYLSQALNAALNVVGLVACLRLSFGGGESGVPSDVPSFWSGAWSGYLVQTAVLACCAALCFAGSALFAKASKALLIILVLATASIPVSAVFRNPFANTDVEFTGLRLSTLRGNLLPHSDADNHFRGLATFGDLFGILFPATSGIFAGASMSGDLRHPSKAIPFGTLWAMGVTFVLYLFVITAMAASTTHASLLCEPNIIQVTSLWAPLIVAGECAVSLFSALMGLLAASKLLQALGRDRLLPGLALFSWGAPRTDEPRVALLLTYSLAQVALFADLNQIATFISMGYMVTFFVTNLACFLLKIGSAPNFRPAFQFFGWQTALSGSIMSAAAMLFIDATYAAAAVTLFVLLFLLIHFFSPPKRWGDVSQNLIYHQVRKYLLRLRPEHIKFWRPQIMLLINNPRRQTRLIQFCNAMKKGSLYILGHAIVTDNFATGVQEAKLQHAMWTEYISKYSKIKAFVQLTMSPSITWGVRNLILSSGLGGMRPNIAVLGFYDMDELRASKPFVPVPGLPIAASPRRQSRTPEDTLPTDVIKTEGLMKVTEYAIILEDLALRHRINVAVAKGFHALEMPQPTVNTKQYLDLWPIQMSAELEADGKNVLTTNFDTYTLILQLGYILHSVPAWKRVYSLRVMVFVEYESEVEEERGRLEALLDKLRIGAEVHVFWLASGALMTYEAIIHGHSSDPSTEMMVDSVLREDSWWDNMRRIRGKATSVSPVDTSTSNRRQTAMPRKRRASLAHIEELQRHKTVSTLARLGLRMGIHTQNLAGGESTDMIGDDSSSEQGDVDPDFNDVESGDELDEEAAVHRPLVPVSVRRKSHSDVAFKHPAMRAKKLDERLANLSNISSATGTPSTTPPRRGYGTMSTTPQSTMDAAEYDRRILQSALTGGGPPSLSSSMKFSSSLVPETRIVNAEETGRTIMFAETAASALLGGRADRPLLSHTNSRAKMAEPAAGPPVSSAAPSNGIGGLLADYRARQREEHEHSPASNDDDANDNNSHTSGSSYATQALALSFNDLPRRAQHLILNELMRQQSGGEAGVLFTTLPIPDEGTGRSEAASVQYLADVELLCQGLPPVLMILSNNMTVTVSL